MAAVRRGRKGHSMRQRSRRQRRPRKGPAARKKLPPSKPERNLCNIRFPRSSYLQTCPLVSWYFNRRVRDGVLSFRRAKRDLLRPCVGHPIQKRPPQAGKPRARACPDFLKVALREVASKKRAQWVVPPDRRRRRRYSDEEIFYRLASPLEEEGAGPTPTDHACAQEDPGLCSPGPPQPAASELQLSS